MDMAILPLPLIFLVSVAVILISSEASRRLGVAASSRGRENVSTLEGSVLGLLALMLGFTFSMALSGFEARRDAVLKEANAIGTTALRARLLPAPHNKDALKLLQEYVQGRLALTQRIPSPAEMDAAIARSTAIQEALWQQVKVVSRQDSAMVPTGLFIQSLNDMIDSQEIRLTALFKRVPNVVLLSLYGIATVAAAFAGYAAGLERQKSRLPIYILVLLVSSVMFLIQDLDRPGSGFIMTSQQPMVRTAASIAGFVE